jgi:hypothetical protein
MTNDLWTETQADDLDVPVRRRAARELSDLRHIGCPLAWFMVVFPIMRSKNELAVALHIYRLRSIRRSRTVAVSNMGLLADLGIDRFTKYRALRRLAGAGLIKIKQHNNKRSLEITFLQKRGRTKWH